MTIEQSDTAGCNVCGEVASETLQMQRGLHVVTGEIDRTFDVRTALCRRCGLIYTDPQPPSALLDAYYASQDRELFVEGEEGDAERIPSRTFRCDQARWLEAQLGDLSGARILEVGCYDGYLLELLGRAGASCIGVEASLDAAEHARRRWGLDVRTGLFEEMGFEPGSFDLVVMSHVLEHVRDPRAMLKACRGLLAEGGHLFLDLPNGVRPRLEHVVNFYCFDHLYNFSPATVTRLGRRTGFAPAALDTEFTTSSFRYLGAAAPAESQRSAVERIDAESVGASRHAVLGYVAGRQTFISSVSRRLLAAVARCRQTPPRIALYGAGVHTEFLLEHTPVGRYDIVALIDGNPKKQGETRYGFPVCSPAAIVDLAPDAVVISSYDFQEEMAATARRFAPADCQIVTLYDQVRALSNYPSAREISGPAIAPA